jgi:single-strand DNA-binding protein
MYLNRVTLIGFIGNDAEKKVAGITNLAIFSLATKTSWKNDSETWESRSEWHRCVAFGKLADFAGGLKKGPTWQSKANCGATSISERSWLARRRRP